MQGAFVEELTSPKAAARIAAGALIVVPVGAAAKEPGPHLPLRTDYLVAREPGRRLADALPVLVTPDVSFGYSSAFVRHPGGRHLRAEMFMALLPIEQPTKLDLVVNLRTGRTLEPHPRPRARSCDRGRSKTQRETARPTVYGAVPLDVHPGIGRQARGVGGSALSGANPDPTGRCRARRLESC